MDINGPICLRTLCIALVTCLFRITSAAGGGRPELYFYPPPTKINHGYLIASPLSLSIDQVTTSFPEIGEMTGIILVIPWSSINPHRGHYNFTLIDSALTFWRGKGKKVVLAISTGGPPILSCNDRGCSYEPQTPTWVSELRLTYTATTSTIGHLEANKRIESEFPSYWDPRIIPLLSEVIGILGQRYDGNPTLSYVRASAGLVVEDEPTPFGAKPEKAPGYTFQRYIEYLSKILDLFQVSFKRTSVEFDISFIPWGYTFGKADDKSKADQFVERLQKEDVFLAFNGWESNASIWFDHSELPGFALNRLMHYLRQDVASGASIGLEAIGPIFVPKMGDNQMLALLAERLNPSRVVFFGSDAAGVLYVRSGSSKQTLDSEAYMQGRPVSLTQLGMRSIDLIEKLRHQSDN